MRRRSGERHGAAGTRPRTAAAASTRHAGGDARPLAELVASALEGAGESVTGSRVLVIGLVSGDGPRSRRPARAADLVAELRTRGVEVVGYADRECDAAASELDVPVRTTLSAAGFDAVLVLERTPTFEGVDYRTLAALDDEPVLVDATGTVDAESAAANGIRTTSYWGI